MNPGRELVFIFGGMIGGMIGAMIGYFDFGLYAYNFIVRLFKSLKCLYLNFIRLMNLEYLIISTLILQMLITLLHKDPRQQRETYDFD